MLELSKTILKRMSFDPFLFKKELKKSLKWIKPHEKMVLKLWCLAQFGHLYKDTILEIFDSSY